MAAYPQNSDILFIVIRRLYISYYIVEEEATDLGFNCFVVVEVTSDIETSSLIPVVKYYIYCKGGALDLDLVFWLTFYGEI